MPAVPCFEQTNADIAGGGNESKRLSLPFLCATSRFSCRNRGKPLYSSLSQILVSDACQSPMDTTSLGIRPGLDRVIHSDSIGTLFLLAKRRNFCRIFFLGLAALFKFHLVFFIFYPAKPFAGTDRPDSFMSRCLNYRRVLFSGLYLGGDFVDPLFYLDYLCPLFKCGNLDVELRRCFIIRQVM